MSGDGDRRDVRHACMRRLILSRFEDDELLLGEVEVWLDALSAPGEEVVSEDGVSGPCYCPCEGRKDCVREAEDVTESEVEVEVELVPGMKFMAMPGSGGKGRRKGGGS